MIPPLEPSETEVAASAATVPMAIGDLGGIIRELRKARKLSLVSFSELSGVSIAMLSHIERGKASPSLKVLEKLRAALGVSMVDLFPPPDTRGNDEALLVTKRHERTSIEFPEIGLTKQRLSPGEKSDFEILLLVIAPGGGSGPEPWTRPGEKGGMVLSGAARLEVSDRAFDLEAGDSFQFNSSQPHRFECIGDKPAKIIWIIKSHPVAAAVDA